MSGQRPMAVTWVQPPSPPGPRTSGSTCVEWGEAVCTGHCEAPGIKNRTMQTVEGGAREVGLLLSWGRGREVGLNELGDSLLSTELEGKLHDTYTLAHIHTLRHIHTHVHRYRCTLTQSFTLSPTHSFSHTLTCTHTGTTCASSFINTLTRPYMHHEVHTFSHMSPHNSSPPQMLPHTHTHSHTHTPSNTSLQTCKLSFAHTLTPTLCSSNSVVSP